MIQASTLIGSSAVAAAFTALQVLGRRAGSQMGWHLGGYDTPHWVDTLLFPDNWRSLARLDPRLVRDLQVGDVLPDGKPGTAALYVATIIPADFVVATGMLHGLRRRVEGRATPQQSGREPLRQELYLAGEERTQNSRGARWRA